MSNALFLPPGFADWRTTARRYLHAGVTPEQAVWDESQLSILEAEPSGEAATSAAPSLVPRDFLRMAMMVACHRDPSRWPLLYRLLWRITRGERHLLTVATDPDVHRALTLAKAVRRAAHKMKAFVRFQRAPNTGDAAHDADPWYIAWFEPAHAVVERTAPFFIRRFPGMRWAILTPERTARWDGTAVAFGDGTTRDMAVGSDALEDLWREYYANTFNPARLAPGAMRAEMPKSYWKNLPETRIIADLMRGAPARVANMIERMHPNRPDGGLA